MRFVTRVKRKVCKMIVQSAIMYSSAITKRQEGQVNLEIKVRKARLRSFGHVQKSVYAEQSMLNMELSGRKEKKRLLNVEKEEMQRVIVGEDAGDRVRWRQMCPLKGRGEKRGRRDQTQQRMSRKAGLIPMRAHSVFINQNHLPGYLIFQTFNWTCC